MDPAKHFHVLIGAPAFVEHLPAGPCLVIDADQDRLDRLRRDLSECQHPYPCRLRCAVLTLDQQTSVQWFSYNDRRFDGVLAPEAWSDHASNLTLLLQETLPGRTLASLLDEADLALVEHQTACIAVRQGDPLAVVAGAGGWRDLIQTVELLSPDAERHWGGVVHSQLEPHGFRPQSGSIHWQRPGVQMLRFLLERIQRQRSDLVAERDEQLAGRRDLAERLEIVSSEHRDELERLAAAHALEMESSRHQLERLEGQLSELNASRDVVVRERDELKHHIEVLQSSHLQAVNDQIKRHQLEQDQALRQWTERETELQMQALQQEAFIRASSAQVGLMADLIAGWGEPREA